MKKITVIDNGQEYTLYPKDEVENLRILLDKTEEELNETRKERDNLSHIALTQQGISMKRHFEIERLKAEMNRRDQIIEGLKTRLNSIWETQSKINRFTPPSEIDEIFQQIDTLIVEYFDGLYDTGEFLSIFNKLRDEYTGGHK